MEQQIGYSMGDAYIVVALTVGVIAFLLLKFLERRRKLEVIHAERLAAIEKGIPLPELPADPVRVARPEDPRLPLMIGIVLLMFGVGAMAALMLVPEFHAAWPMPLPVAFIGAGLVLYYFLAGGDPDGTLSSRRGH